MLMTTKPKPKQPPFLNKSYFKEFWYGDPRDGSLENIDGYHYFKINEQGDILEAFEYYEGDDGEEHISAMQDFIGINWFQDLGYEDDELLESIPEIEYLMIVRHYRQKNLNR